MNCDRIRDGPYSIGVAQKNASFAEIQYRIGKGLGGTKSVSVPQENLPFNTHRGDWVAQRQTN